MVELYVIPRYRNCINLFTMSGFLLSAYFFKYSFYFCFASFLHVVYSVT